MKARRTMLAVIALFIFGCLQNATFTEFVSEEGGFSVSMPGTPTEETQSIPTEAGDIEIHMFSIESGSTAYLVGYSDYPPDVIEIVDSDMLLDSARDGAVGDGALLSEKSITLGDYPGRELTVETSDEGIMVYARVYLVGNRLYQVVVSTGDDALTEEMRGFLDSFKLLE